VCILSLGAIAACACLLKGIWASSWKRWEDGIVSNGKMSKGKFSLLMGE